MPSESHKPELTPNEKPKRIVRFEPDVGEPFEVDLDTIEIKLITPEKGEKDVLLHLYGIKSETLDFQISDGTNWLGEIFLLLEPTGYATVIFSGLDEEKKKKVPLKIDDSMIFAEGLNKLATKFKLKQSLVVNAGKGIGKEAYTKLAEYLKSNHQITLRSSTNRNFYSENMWRSLEKRGLAKRVKLNPFQSCYEFIDQEK